MSVVGPKKSPIDEDELGSWAGWVSIATIRQDALAMGRGVPTIVDGSGVVQADGDATVMCDGDYIVTRIHRASLTVVAGGSEKEDANLKERGVDGSGIWEGVVDVVNHVRDDENGIRVVGKGERRTTMRGGGCDEIHMEQDGAEDGVVREVHDEPNEQHSASDEVDGDAGRNPSRTTVRNTNKITATGIRMTSTSDKETNKMILVYDICR
ncbi:hypothetical protein S245_005516 [Arachis hypogaea]